MAKKKSKVGAISALVAIGAVMIVINTALSRLQNTIALGLGSVYSSSVNTSASQGAEENYLEGFEASVNIMSEGTVLMKNTENLLPLKENSKVTILGAGSYNYVLGGTGSAGGKEDEYTISMYDALAEAGLDINDKVWNNLEYACGGSRGVKSRYGGSEISTYVSGYESTDGWLNYVRVHEFTKSTYTDYIATDSAIGKYNDTAIITLARSGAEGASPLLDYDGDGSTTTGTTYFQLQQDEKDLLTFAKEKFEHTIVLINSSSQMELGFLDQEEYGIDAALWIGHPGEAGLVGVGYVLTGIMNPSGHLVDTYAYDQSTTPSYYNTDNNAYANSELSNNAAGKFYQYEEGIYVGYRYYETADSTGYFDSSTFKNIEFKNGKVTAGGYENVVQFPFGYGESYTTFKQSIKNSDVKLEVHGTNTITVTVQNTGSVKGKDLVQLYVDAPYNQDSSLGISGKGLEKSKVTLVAFAKTDEIEPGASAEVTLSFQTDDVSSYDNFGQGCYVLEKGEYKFNLQEDAHHWGEEGSENAISDRVSVTLPSTYVYNNDGVGARDSDKKAAVNAFDSVTAGDGNMLDGYLSRSDFAGGMATIMTHQSNETANEMMRDEAVQAVTQTGTSSMEYSFQTYIKGVKTTLTETIYAHGNNAAPWMEKAPDGQSVSDLVKAVTDTGAEITNDKVYYLVVDGADTAIDTVDTDGDGTLDDFNLYENESDIPSEELAIGSATRKVKVDDLSTVDGDNIKWDQLVNMCSLQEQQDLFGHYGWSSPAIESVDKKATVCKDGSGEPNNGGNDMMTWFPSATTTAAAWNPDLAHAAGVAYGHQAEYCGLGASYAPAMNIHRSPFGGRNFEYYSEDGFISGHIGGSMAQGINDAGVSVFVKHMALNDGDTNRGGNCTWANEQAIREIYMRPYEILTKTYQADGIMGSLNRIGLSWAHYGMYTVLPRDEWNWHGHLITDGDGSAGETYNNPVFWLSGTQGSMLGTFELSDDQTVAAYGDTSYNSDLGKYLLHQTSRHALYQYGHTGAVEGNFAWWWTGIWVGLNVVLSLGFVAIAFSSFVLPAIKKGKKDAQ